MPVQHLVRALHPAVPDDVAASGEKLSYRDFLMVALILDAEDLFPDNWIYVHTPGRQGRPHPELQQLEQGNGPPSPSAPASGSSTSASRTTTSGRPPTKT